MCNQLLEMMGCSSSHAQLWVMFYGTPRQYFYLFIITAVNFFQTASFFDIDASYNESVFAPMPVVTQIF
jgi:hypothetical protein